MNLYLLRQFENTDITASDFCLVTAANAADAAGIHPYDIEDKTLWLEDGRWATDPKNVRVTCLGVSTPRAVHNAYLELLSA